jgi:chromosomal replication initiator protein
MTPAGGEIRDKILRELASLQIEKDTFDTWLKDLPFGQPSPDVVEISLPNQHVKEYYERYWRSKLEPAARKACGPGVQLVFLAGQEAVSPDHAVPAARVHVAQPCSCDDGVVLNPDYVFDNFIVGQCNRLAYSAAVATADAPGKAYNPLFIYGGFGLGKTHLLEAMCHSVRARSPRARICYIPAEAFVNEFVTALQTRKVNEFRDKFRNMDFLVVDDVHFFSDNRPACQEEFFHTFNHLHNSQKQIIVSCDTGPKDMHEIHERLRSRFEWGFVVSIGAPCKDTRLAILQAKAARRGVVLPPDVVMFIADNIKTNVRELEGAVIKLGAHSHQSGRQIDLDFAREVLADSLPSAPRVLNLSEIVQRTAAFHEIKMSSLLARTRQRSITSARQVGMYAARCLTKHSLDEIGSAFGAKDHTTVLYAVQKIEAQIKENPEFQRSVEQFLTSLRATDDMN